MALRIFAAGKDGKLEQPTDLKKAAKLSETKEVWVDCENPSREDAEAIGKAFKLHPLSVEDSLNERQRAKLDEYPDYSYLVIHAVGLTETLSATQLNLFLGENFVVTIHRKPMKAVEDVLALVKSKPEVLGKGADYVAHALMDELVDGVFPILDHFEERISGIEEQIFESTGASTTRNKKIVDGIFRLKKDLLQVRKVIWPHRETIHALLTRRVPYLHEEAVPYFRDVYDHLIRITDMIETYRELLASTMEAYLSVVSNNLNVVMKKLTAITAIVMVPALVAGIYGMNFAYIPELRAEWGFFEALAIMAVSALALFTYFRL
ncbi:MAG: magnesium/cobalt transporter CorA, partial [Candidatus Micrarchaeota archaeon]